MSGRYWNRSFPELTLYGDYRPNLAIPETLGDGRNVLKSELQILVVIGSQSTQYSSSVLQLFIRLLREAQENRLLICRYSGKVYLL